MSSSDLSTKTFWQELAERAMRQAGQTIIPIVAVAVSGGQPFDGPVVVGAAFIAIVVSVAKSLLRIQLHPDEAFGWQLLDRAVPAMAGTALGFFPADQAGIIVVDWRAVAVASVGAGVLAILSFYAAPPASVHTTITGRHAA